MIQNPHSAGSWLVVEVVAKIRLTGLEIVQNPHSIGFWLLMEVVYHSATTTIRHDPKHPQRQISVDGGGGRQNPINKTRHCPKFPRHRVLVVDGGGVPQCHSAD